MKAIDEVDSRRGRLVWAVVVGGGCGSEMGSAGAGPAQ